MTRRSKLNATLRAQDALKAVDQAEAYLRDMEALVRSAEARKHTACQVYAFALAELEVSIDVELVSAKKSKRKIG